MRKKLSPQKKQKRKDLIKAVILFLLIEFALVIFFLFMLDNTKQATESNTEVIQVTSAQIYLEKNPNRWDAVVFLCGNEVYKLTSVNFPDSDLPDLIEAMQGEKTLTLTVRMGFDTLRLYGKRSVVDVRSDSEIYYDIEWYNDYEKTERVNGITMCVLLWLVTTFFSGGWVLLNKYG